MSTFARFIDRLHRILPDQLSLIEKLAAQYRDEPFAVMHGLTERHLISHAKVCQAWGDSLGVAYVNPFEVQLPTGDGNQLPQEVATIAKAIVLNSLEDAARVGMATPQNTRLVASFQKILGREISPVFSHPDEISAVLDLHFTNEKTLAASLQKACENLPVLEGGRELESGDQADDLLQGESFNELFNSILFTAFGRKASDIHFEVDVSEGRIRMRVDGRLTEILKLPRLIYNAMIVRIKVLSGLDISQSRIPQDGAFEIQFGGKRLAFRASTMPTIYGQKAVRRVNNRPRSFRRSDFPTRFFTRSNVRSNARTVSCSSAGPPGAARPPPSIPASRKLIRPTSTSRRWRIPLKFACHRSDFRPPVARRVAPRPRRGTGGRNSRW